MAISIRKMRLGDLDQAMGILSEWNMAPIAPSPEIPDPERSGIAIANSFVAVSDRRVVGICSYIVHSAVLAETASLAVHSDYRGKGVGHKLQRARLREMKRRGIQTVRSETDRAETVEWYVQKFGYHVQGQAGKKHAFSLPDVDHWTVLELDLETYDPS